MSTMFGRGLMGPPVRPAVFVSYHHGSDRAYYDAFTKLYARAYGIPSDTGLGEWIQGPDVESMIRSVGAKDRLGAHSCTIVLCGLATRWRKSVDWEIKATLDEAHGLVGVQLPNLRMEPDGGSRLQDNIDSGYAEWITWRALRDDPTALTSCIENAMARPKDLIRNGRALRLSNGGP